MKTMHGVSWSGGWGWGWVAHYVGREDGGAASDSDREMAMYVYTWVSRTLDSWRSYSLVFLSSPLQLLLRGNLV